MASGQQNSTGITVLSAQDGLWSANIALIRAANAHSAPWCTIKPCRLSFIM